MCYNFYGKPLKFWGVYHLTLRNPYRGAGQSRLAGFLQPTWIFRDSYACEWRSKEKADNRTNAFDYRNIKRGSNACIIVSYIIKKNVMGNILDMMIDELYTYFLFGFVFSIFNSQIPSTIRRSWFSVSCLTSVQMLFLT